MASTRGYTLREAAELSTKGYHALRAMADRGQLKTTGGGKPGKPRRVTTEALLEAGILDRKWLALRNVDATLVIHQHGKPDIELKLSRVIFELAK